MTPSDVFLPLGTLHRYRPAPMFRCCASQPFLACVIRFRCAATATFHGADRELERADFIPRQKRIALSYARYTLRHATHAATRHK
jgi:hypothetical protein